MFSGTAVSLNLNLGACFIKVKDYDRVGQLCSAVLCFDTTNVKAYYRRAIAALGLNKPTLAFIDLAQALKIDPNNSESQQKLKEVISLLGWSPDFVDEALAVTRKDEKFRDYVRCGKEDNGRKLGKKGKRKEGDGREDGYVRRCSGVKDDTKMEKDVGGNSLDLAGKVNPTNQDPRPNVIDTNCVLKGTSKTKNPNLTGSSFRCSSQKRNDSYLCLTPTIYGAISKGRTVQYFCSRQKNFITIRVANTLKKMDSGETQEVSPPMEFSHPPVEGYDRCETTPDLMQEDPSIGMAGLESSCEAASTLLPVSPVSSPLQTPVHPRTSSSDLMFGFVSPSRPWFRRKYATLQSRSPTCFINSLFCRLSGSKRIVSWPTEYTWFPRRKKFYGPTPNVLPCNSAFFT